MCNADANGMAMLIIRYDTNGMAYVMGYDKQLII